MADKYATDLDLLKFHIKEESSPTSTKVEEVDEEIIKTETEISGGSWVYQNVDINELPANEKRNLENSEYQLLNKNADIKKETFEDDSNIWERINNLSANSQKHNESRLDFDNENMNFDGEEMMSQQNLMGNVELNKKEEKIKFLYKDNDCLSTHNLKKRALVSQKKCVKHNLNHAKGKKQMSEPNNYNATEKKYKCNECSYAAVNKSCLLSHIKYRHTMEKRYKCNECSYTAIFKSKLLSHFKACHTMEKPYKCNECSYASAIKSNLLTHIKSHHTMEKPYKCTECSYAAVNKCNLLSHIKSRHTVEKPFKCNECSYATVRKNNLLLHIQSHHTMEKPYKCNKCSYAAVRKHYLQFHIQFHHTI